MKMVRCQQTCSGRTFVKDPSAPFSALAVVRLLSAKKNDQALDLEIKI